MTDRWLEIDVFTRVAESGSFSRAAQELGLSQPSTSRIVTGLEARLGVKLLLRTTRNMSLTEAGAAFLERARQAAADLEEAEDAARGIDSLRGTLRLAVPVMYGARAVIPALSGFLERYPDLRVEITMRDERQNLVAAGVDMAIRMGTLEDSTFGARQIASVARMLVAAPAYLAKRGVPETPEELVFHDALLHEQSFSEKSTIKLFKAGTERVVTLRGRVRIDAAPGILAAATAGLGIANVTTLMSAQERQDGSLIQLLPDYELEPLKAFAVFPSGPRPSAKVQALVTHLIAVLGN
ncbi:TPA: LysR family transcriptional regulator [Klebsiella pneumoniae]|nr:LysR family transcriptional regulator [Klebsiella pneumoniae]HBW7250338.1 LysR family transcriptional regulator [Klebsiella pneumoniae]HBW8163516.1 LysR family transcriptional regulator [Klebsiella pneumoniae]HBW8261911.1 LysR family transcriptional regulator [Klebsiella pneumoniae]HBW8267447.1 LysR family transcriptional regulator [Klebsiella pneumoniae]